MLADFLQLSLPSFDVRASLMKPSMSFSSSLLPQTSIGGRKTSHIRLFHHSNVHPSFIQVEKKIIAADQWDGVYVIDFCGMNYLM